MRRAICFDDVLLVPKMSDIETRTDIDVSTNLGGDLHLSLPIVSAPMDTVTGPEMAAAMHEAGGLGILHRYNTIDEQAELVKQLLLRSPTAKFGAAIGITGDFYERAEALRDVGCRVFCLDVAHGHHSLMRDALTTLRGDFGDGVHLMAGNIATIGGFNNLVHWGADSVRVGVGGGSICSTRVQTGHGVPTLQSVMDCAASQHAGEVKIIADGGIKNSGDMVKALAAGADAVMCGSLLAGTDETPGMTLRADDGSPPLKIYRGMASREAQKAWRGKVGSVEGVSTTIPIKGCVRDVLHDLEWGIRSGLSYTGARDLIELYNRAEFLEQSSASQMESSPHALLLSR